MGQSKARKGKGLANLPHKALAQYGNCLTRGSLALISSASFNFCPFIQRERLDDNIFAEAFEGLAAELVVPPKMIYLK